MSTKTIPEPSYEPLAYPGETVEAQTQLGVVEDCVNHVDVVADYGHGPQYIYHLEGGLQVYDAALR